MTKNTPWGSVSGLVFCLPFYYNRRNKWVQKKRGQDCWIEVVEAGRKVWKIRWSGAKKSVVGKKVKDKGSAKWRTIESRLSCGLFCRVLVGALQCKIFFEEKKVRKRERNRLFFRFFPLATHSSLMLPQTDGNPRESPVNSDFYKPRPSPSPKVCLLNFPHTVSQPYEQLLTESPKHIILHPCVTLSRWILLRTHTYKQYELVSIPFHINIAMTNVVIRHHVESNEQKEDKQKSCSQLKSRIRFWCLWILIFRVENGCASLFKYSLKSIEILELRMMPEGKWILGTVRED